MKFVNSFLKVFAGTGVPAPTDARRANALLCAPPKWGLRPHDPYGEGAPPLHPGGFCRDGSPCSSNAGAPREHGLAMLGTRVTFVSRRKSPKARQGLRPLESPGARFSPFSRSLTHRAGLVCATEKDRFATLRFWANRSLLLPLAP